MALTLNIVCAVKCSWCLAIEVGWGEDKKKKKNIFSCPQSFPILLHLWNFVIPLWWQMSEISITSQQWGKGRGRNL